MASNRCLVIGISGTTNSGKSTVASMLKSSLPNIQTFCQDDYFYEPEDPRVPQGENGFENWDCLEAMDMDKMVADVNQWIETQEKRKSPSLLLIEGFIIFNHRYLSQLFDKKYFIKVDKSTSAERRVKRTYNPPDVPGYFDNVVWPAYVKNLEDIQDQKDIEYVDGSNSLDDIYTRLLKDIKTLMHDREEIEAS